MTVSDTGFDFSRPAFTTPASAVDGPLEVVDLLNDLESLGAMLRAELDRAVAVPCVWRDEHVLDAFLLAAGACQIVEDHLHRQSHPLEAIARRLERPGLGVARASVRGVARGVASVRGRQDRGVAGWHAELVELASALAELVMQTAPPDPGACEAPLRAALHKAVQLQARLPSLPESLRRTILRLPDSFRTFDQRPEDCDRLAARFARAWPDRGVPLVVAGVRTSGSYLAPLQAVSLRRIGFGSVEWMSYRPGHALLPGERDRLAQLRDRGGKVLVIDDPPVTGSKLAGTAESLGRFGVPVVLLVPLLGGDGALPAPLRRYPVVALPWSDWAFHDCFESSAIRGTLADLLNGTVDGVERVDLDPVGELRARPLTRSHLRGRFRVDLSGSAGRCSVDVYVKGTGLGYLGRHSLALCRRLDGYVPETFGWRDGFLFRRALPESARLTDAGDLRQADAVAIADYVAGRAERLPAGEDTSLRLRRRHPVWELAADVLADGYGRAAPLAAPLMRRAAMRILACPTPSIVDGSAALPHWFRDGEPGSLLKVDFDERAFSVWDHYCYDPAWDLAVAAGDHAAGAGEASDFGALLLAAYQERTGQAVSEERWFLYRTVYLLSLRRHFARLLRQGPGQLQTDAGSPPLHPDVTEDGFEGELAAGIRACDAALASVRKHYLAATGRKPAPSPGADLVVGALEGGTRHVVRRLAAAASTLHTWRT